MSCKPITDNHNEEAIMRRTRLPPFVLSFFSTAPLYGATGGRAVLVTITVACKLVPAAPMLLNVPC